MDTKGLREALHELASVPALPGLSKQELLKRSKDIALWVVLPLAELRTECRERSISTVDLRPQASEDDQREQLIDRLLLDICSDFFEKTGVPTERLQNFKACASVASGWTALEEMSLVDITQRYSDASGVPSKGLPRMQLLERLKQIELWLNLPFVDLQKECRAKNVNSIGTEKDREQFVLSLVYATWVNPVPLPEEPPPQPKKPPEPSPPPKQPPRNKGVGPGNFMPGARGKGVPPPGSRPGKGAPPARFTTEVDEMRAHFFALHLPPSAGTDDVKKAYRQLALKCHPDKHQGESAKLQERAADEFRKITEAYEKLTNYLKSKGR
eukprot:gnl/TRDRNA2_/TRDRNA2_169644_c2_seq3.p1 gnl/TRDRNA2_/TRDRNA2_169644_c2~~gnl/TRDRNA2_/TRDRNA2_169644_c2_seq3.p1  ORF type:complete len:340 (-),score=57.78 gnl/TRDRNA2_/TRDRNA2_169644_c2_seq3:137-1114(-)